MKKSALSLMFLIAALSAFAQEQPIVKDKAYYHQKSKHQKSTAVVLLIGGGVAVGIGLLVGNRDESSFEEAGIGAIIGGLGVLSMIGSIPLFMASGKNKRKANLMVRSTPLPLNPLSFRSKTQLNVGISISM